MKFSPFPPNFTEFGAIAANHKSRLGTDCPGSSHPTPLIGAARCPPPLPSGNTYPRLQRHSKQLRDRSKIEGGQNFSPCGL
ncbi:hypothetical protein JJD41_09510 [Oxynema sp. CENA135]|uniref:hypothetical protein n=1 Tax=Oxynema sp. CENA135 TaxID=984206 RepID=UPI0019092EAE|nr:hypothetical protein [Oxynema sp. CENA135]MBK4730091.1 hypothetical protein [Oxynema sp. CENA135]